MTITIGWLELLVIVGGWVIVNCVGAWFQSKQPPQGSIDMVPGSVLGQAPDMEMEEAKLGFRA